MVGINIASSKVEKPQLVTKITEMPSLSHYIAAQTNSVMKNPSYSLFDSITFHFNFCSDKIKLIS